MNARAVRADAAYVLRGWARSPAGIVVSLGMPLVLLLALGLLFGDAPATPGAPAVAVVDLAGTPEAERLVALLVSSGSIAARSGEAGPEASERMVQADVSAVVEIAPGFSGSAEHVRVYVNTANPADERMVLAALDAALARLAAPADAEAPRAPPVERVALAAPPDYRAFLLPGALGLAIVMTALPTGFTSVAELRHAGLLERLAVSPMTKREWLLARMLGASVVALGAAAVLILVARLALHVDVRLSGWTLLLLVGGTLVFSGLGVLLGAAVRNPASGGAAINLVLLPLVFLSGSFFELARLPAFLRTLSLASPLTHLNEGLRADMLLADGAAAAPHALGLLVGAALILALASRLVRWHHDG